MVSFAQNILWQLKIIQKLTVGFINESYFLYDKSNVIEQTFVTEINKLISIYGSIIDGNLPKLDCKKMHYFLLIEVDKKRVSPSKQ